MKTDPKTQASEPGAGGSGRDLPNSVTLALGQNVKHHRHAAKLSQMNLAFESEMERSHVSRIERGVSNPSLFALATICHVLKITLSELFDGITDTIAPTSQGWAGAAQEPIGIGESTATAEPQDAATLTARIAFQSEPQP